MGIGERIRKEREARGMSLAHMAQLVGASKMTLHRVETGKTSPSIALLGEIAQALDKTLTGLIQEEAPGFLSIARRKEQARFDEGQLKGRVVLPRQKVRIENDTVAIHYVETQPGSKVDAHCNEGFELVLTLSGKTTFVYDGREYTSGPGDMFFYDGRRPHSCVYHGSKFILISFV